MITDVSAATAAAQELAAQLDPGRVLLSGRPYDEARRLWNGAVTNRPALIARCRTPAEVQACVRAARRHRLPLSVRGGGHDWAGRALRDGGLVVDVSEMRNVAVDAEARVATAAGGATAGDLIAAAAPRGLCAAVGTVGSVGVTGLTLGGGYGPLNGRFGLAADNLLGAQVVLADGRLLVADEAHEPELYWALRGGGGNFGVVTSTRVRLHPVERVLAGFVLFPWSQAADVLAGLRAAQAAAPDELTAQSGALPDAEGRPVLFLSPVWSGELARGAEAIEALRRLGSPLTSQVAPRTYLDMLRFFDPYVVPGRHYAMSTRSAASLTPSVVSAFIAAGSAMTSPLSGIIIHNFHGASTRVPEGSTAFGLRREHLMFEFLAAWEQGDDGARHRAWADSASAALAPYALPGGYPGLLAPDSYEQIAHAYGGNAARLLAAKARFDPEGVFSSIPLPPRAVDPGRPRS